VHRRRQRRHEYRRPLPALPAEPGRATRKLRLAPGNYSLEGVSLANGVSLSGAGPKPRRSAGRSSAFPRALASRPCASRADRPAAFPSRPARLRSSGIRSSPADTPSGAAMPSTSSRRASPEASGCTARPTPPRRSFIARLPETGRPSRGKPSRGASPTTARPAVSIPWARIR
jgi:hypothetical protein